MGRAVLFALALALAACDSAQEPMRQVTIETPGALGLSLQELPAQALRASGLSYGLSIVSAGQLARKAGLQVGDIVYAVNERRLQKIEDFMRIVAERPGGSLGLRVRRGNADFYVPVDFGDAPSKETLLRT
jgi:S1-C subfamily serine protease